MRTTGYVLGGVSPLAQKKPLPTFLHDAAQELETIFVSAGRRGLEIELAPDDLIALTKGRFTALTHKAVKDSPCPNTNGYCLTWMAP